MINMPPEEWGTVHKSMAWTLETMLKHAPESPFKEMFTSILSNGAAVEDKVYHGDKSSFSSEEEVLVGLTLVDYKESHWVFAGIDGAKLANYRNLDQARIGQLASAIYKVDFWKRVTESTKQYLTQSD